MKYKYDEDKSIQKLKDYIDGTYAQHYVGSDGIQTIDVWDSLQMATSMCQGTAIKYLMRYGKKDGYNEKDLLKALHYIVLLMRFADNGDN